MSDHKHGEMDTSEHEAMFGGFMTFISRSVVVIVGILIFAYMVNG
ncbi:aa3-type cytochrome c oxidase subunit IV [Lentibacter sp.]